MKMIVRLLGLLLIATTSWGTSSEITRGDTAKVSAGKTLLGSAGSIFDLTAITPDSILGTVLVTGSFNIGTASNFKLAGTAATFGMAGLNAVTDGSVLTTQHYHSALSASDGSPASVVSVSAGGATSISSTAILNGTTPVLTTLPASTPTELQGSLSTYNAQLGLFDTRSAAQGVGGSVLFVGYSNGLASPIGYAQISGVKEDNVAGQQQGVVVFSTDGGGGRGERARITSGGVLGINETTPSGEAVRLNVYDNTASSLPVVYKYQDNASATAPTDYTKSDAANAPALKLEAAATNGAVLYGQGGGWTGPTVLSAGSAAIADDATLVIESQAAGGSGSASAMYLLTAYGASGAGGYAIVGARNHIAGGANMVILAQGGNWTWEVGTANPGGTTGTDGRIGLYSYSVASNWYCELENRGGETITFNSFSLKGQ